MTYIALGDSLAFGETDFTHNPVVRRPRLRVAVSPTAWRPQNGGVRPNVVNLGVDGETSTSFFGGGQASAAQNLNYPSASTSQNTLLISHDRRSSRPPATRSATVTVSLGANDLFAVVGSAELLHA